MEIGRHVPDNLNMNRWSFSMECMAIFKWNDDLMSSNLVWFDAIRCRCQTRVYLKSDDHILCYCMVCGRHVHEHVSQQRIMHKCNYTYCMILDTKGFQTRTPHSAKYNISYAICILGSYKQENIKGSKYDLRFSTWFFHELVFPGALSLGPTRIVTKIRWDIQY